MVSMKALMSLSQYDMGVPSVALSKITMMSRKI